MTVIDIVTEWLRDHEYDGLYSDGDCACKLDDLIPCVHEGALNCSPGYCGPCPEDCGCGSFHIFAEKPEAV